jgi:peptide/nickel transport system substrate-binding protein
LDPDQWLWPNLHSGEPFSQTNDEEFDKLLKQARYEMDRAKREKLYHKANRYVYDQAYLAVLYEQKDLFGVSKRVDFTPRGDEMIFMWEAKVIK